MGQFPTLFCAIVVKSIATQPMESFAMHNTMPASMPVQLAVGWIPTLNVVNALFLATTAHLVALCRPLPFLVRLAATLTNWVLVMNSCVNHALQGLIPLPQQLPVSTAVKFAMLISIKTNGEWTNARDVQMRN
jgi:hypothetical protein